MGCVVALLGSGLDQGRGEGGPVVLLGCCESRLLGSLGVEVHAAGGGGEDRVRDWPEEKLCK